MCVVDSTIEKNMFLLLALLCVGAQGIYRDSGVIESKVAALTYHTNPKSAGGVHHNGDPVFITNATAAQLCITTPVSVCSIDWPGSAKCLSVSPDCTWYNWRYAEVASNNRSLYSAQENSITPWCVEFYIRGNVSLTFRWDLQGEWPALSDGVLARIGPQNSKADLEMLELYCPRQTYGFGGCYVEHNISFILVDKGIGATWPVYEESVVVVVGTLVVFPLLAFFMLGHAPSEQHLPASD